MLFRSLVTSAILAAIYAFVFASLVPGIAQNIWLISFALLWSLAFLSILGFVYGRRLKKEKKIKEEDERRLKAQEKQRLEEKRIKEEREDRIRQERIYKERLAKGEQERLVQLAKVRKLKEEEKK